MVLACFCVSSCVEKSLSTTTTKGLSWLAVFCILVCCGRLQAGCADMPQAEHTTVSQTSTKTCVTYRESLFVGNTYISFFNKHY